MHALLARLIRAGASSSSSSGGGGQGGGEGGGGASGGLLSATETAHAAGRVAEGLQLQQWDVPRVRACRAAVAAVLVVLAGDALVGISGRGCGRGRGRGNASGAGRGQRAGDVASEVEHDDGGGNGNEFAPLREYRDLWEEWAVVLGMLAGEGGGSSQTAGVVVQVDKEFGEVVEIGEQYWGLKALAAEAKTKVDEWLRM